MTKRSWLVLLGVAFVLGLGVLSVPDSPVQASGCEPQCSGDQCCHLGTCYSTSHPNCSGSSCGQCSTLYNGNVLTGNCAYNGGSGSCFCPLPGTITEHC